MNIYVIQETDIGEGELYGQFFSNLMIFEKESVDKIAQEYMENNDLVVEFDENEKWNFHHLIDELNEKYEHVSMCHTQYQMDVKELDLNNVQDLNELFRLLDVNENADSNFPLGFEEDFFDQAFENDEIYSLNIFDKFSLKEIKVFDVQFEDKTIHTVKK